MVPQLYLITPANADLETFPKALMTVLSEAEFAALLVTRGTLGPDAYAKLAAKLVNIGQGAGCAVLVEDDVALVKKIGADGVHITTGAEDLADAVAALKPSMIVGAGNVASRHDAMTAGEMDIDYVAFTDPDLAQWWAETFEVPGVLIRPEAKPGAADALGSEFLALSDSIWTAPSPAEAIRAIVADLETDA
ncbi:MAG: thiamine phosphate synthase [Candidatus Devosia phytovorans]|uniref:Thiamine phosphate synthase n=1 Tax=Candidatus Devosia phytovorans TaxID=3121372 RepID=A0AAJ5VWV6_9HYPH|nr:thiamine phosphate synthase [Devosia sp.]WEK04879.1 MAG: thiamine phosphate synthase [Devosia sp.]